MDSGPPLVSRIAAAGAAGSVPDPADPRSQKLPFFLVRFPFCLTVRTDLPYEPLGQDAAQAAGRQIRLRTHVQHPHHSPRRVVRMKRGEHQMARYRGPYTGLQRLAVPGLSHHDHVRILAQGSPEPRFKRKPGLGIDLHLADAPDVLLHWILNGHNVHRKLRQSLQDHIKRRRLAGACGPGDIKDPVGPL